MLTPTRSTIAYADPKAESATMRTLCQRFAIILARLNILAEVFLPVHKGLHEEYLIVFTQKGV